MILITHPMTLSHKYTPTIETTHEQHALTYREVTWFVRNFISFHQNFEPHLILKVHSLQLSAAWQAQTLYKF